MCGPRTEHCVVCGREINEFTDVTNYMRCPESGKYHDVIQSKMPVFSSKEDRDAAVEALRKSGMDISTFFEDRKERTFGFYIPELENSLRKLMELIPVDGAMIHHESLVCAKCVKGLKHCITCSAEHLPACPVCKAVLVPLREKKS